MKNALVLLILFATVSASAKTLTANCQSRNGKSLDLVSEIVNVNTPQTIRSLVVNGDEVSTFRDISEMPVYQNGNISLHIQFGKHLYSSAELSLTKCNDDFEATGKATLKEHVGGFAGTSSTELTCTCSLK